jgi:hypothetical protein
MRNRTLISAMAQASWLPEHDHLPRMSDGFPWRQFHC